MRAWLTEIKSMRVFFLGLLVFHEFGFGSSKTGKCTPKKLEITSMNIDDHLGFHGADACFDGNLDNFCHSGTSAAKSIFSHPASEGKLSLWLTLNRIEDISYVRIYNRKGCCQDRFGAHQIQLSTDRGHNWDSTCFTGVLPSNDGPTDEACVGTADTLRLLQTTPNWIHLAEVEVYGGCGPIRCSPGTFKDGAACTNCTVGQYQEDYDKDRKSVV